MLLLNRATERHKDLECSGSGSQDERGAEVGWMRGSVARRLNM
jgi:hypothetical protein